MSSVKSHQSPMILSKRNITLWQWLTVCELENCHRNSWFTHKWWWFSVATLVYQRVWYDMIRLQLHSLWCWASFLLQVFGSNDEVSPQGESLMISGWQCGCLSGLSGQNPGTRGTLSCLMDSYSLISMAISGTDSLEVPTIYKAYFWGLCKGISPQNMALYGTVPPF